MTSKEAIQKLNDKFPKYDIQVEAVSGPVNTFTFKAIISIFEHTEKGAVINKKSQAYGSADKFEKGQDQAIVKAVQGLGL